MRLSVMTLLGIVIVAVPAGAQTPNTIPAPADQAGARATLNDVGWQVGDWVGTRLNGAVEESWSAPASGAMMGTFRLLVDGKVSFYEFFTLVEENGSGAEAETFQPRHDGLGGEGSLRHVPARQTRT